MSLPELAWIAEARRYIGQREVKGIKHNPFIVGIWSSIGASWFRDDETPWCAGFVAYCLKVGGKPILKPAVVGRALAWLNYGVAIGRPAYGCLAVKSRQGGGHVGFVVGRTVGGHILILGGNQDDSVKISAYNPDVFSFRWPGEAPLPGRYDLPVFKDGAAAAAMSEA